MHYLRESRLTSAHTAIKESRGKNVSVTTIAIAHGFLHLGRFSVEYRRYFGVSPSQTLNQN
jgi:transcriptional regulator GlxA family with amidase domain